MNSSASFRTSVENMNEWSQNRHRGADLIATEIGETTNWHQVILRGKIFLETSRFWKTVEHEPASCHQPANFKGASSP